MPRPAPKDSDLNALVVDLLTMLREEFRGHRVDVKLDLASPAPRAFVDPGQLRQALINVLKNSQEAMPEGGTLTVATARHNGHATIEIADTGTGMSAEIRRRVFEPFFTTKPEGTGLGLSLTQQIVAEHQGAIELHPGPSGGTRVLLSLPVAETRTGAQDVSH